jgi:predicted aldo/keto reductase-like oxidoreductase
MKLTLKEKEKLAEDFNISLGTFYNWEKTKPRLIEIILLGLQKENDITNNLDGFSNIDEVVGKMIPVIKELEEKVKRLEEQNK